MKNTTRILSSFLIFGLLITTIFLYGTFYLKDQDTTAPLEDTQDLQLFQGGFDYLLSEDYDEAINYYQTLSEKLTDQRIIDKNANLILILKRLQNASTIYYSEKELLVLAEDFKYDFLDPWYESLSPVYDFYDLSKEVILEKNYDKEEQLVNLYLDNKEDFSNLLRKARKIESNFLTDSEKEFFYLNVHYSIYPTEMFYKTAYLQESISEEEIEKVELAWNQWEDYYMKVMDYYQNFEEGIYLLNEEVEKLREGYQDMKTQLTLLVPELKPDTYM